MDFHADENDGSSTKVRVTGSHLYFRIPYFIGVVNSLSIASRTNPRIVNIDYMNDLAIQLFDCYFDLGKDEVGSSNLPSSSMKTLETQRFQGFSIFLNTEIYNILTSV